jgi:hypothetical protein
MAHLARNVIFLKKYSFCNLRLKVKPLDIFVVPRRMQFFQKTQFWRGVEHLCVHMAAKDQNTPITWQEFPILFA